MTNEKNKFNRLMIISFTLVLTLVVATQVSFTAQPQDDQVGSRHICPKQAMRNGVCVPNPDGTVAKTSSGKQQKEPRYTRVAKQTNTVAKCNIRVQQAQKIKTQNVCEARVSAGIQDLPLTAQKIGLTIWHLRKAERDYEGARLLTHPSKTKSAVAYRAERIKGDPVLSYGDLVRLGIESPRNGYLYVFDRELYHDGSLSAPYMIFPTTRLRDGNNKIYANRPIEVPGSSDDPIYFEAKRVGLDPSKELVGEILSIVVTDKPIASLGNFGSDATKIPEREMASLENHYAGRAEVFELESGVGLPYSFAELEAADHGGSRLLTHKDPVPQTFYLVEEKGNGGLLVTVALVYRG